MSGQQTVPARGTIVRDEARVVVKRRRNKALATILDAKERIVDPVVEPTMAEALRKVILDEVNGLCEIAFAVMESVAREDVALNQLYFDKLDAVLIELRGDRA
jgi:hypothetical protein